MPTLTDSLKARYEAVLGAPTDRLFYQSLHQYFDFVIKTPALNEIFEASAKEYRAKHGVVHKHGPARTDAEADDNQERTIRLERFNLYAVGCTILVRIYLPLEDYKDSLDEPEFEQDPVAVVMMRGIKNINPEYAKRNPFKWSKDKLKSINRWFEGQRGTYEGELRYFHLLLLAAVEKIPQKVEAVESPIPNIETPLRLNPRTGSFSLYGVEGNFSPASQEFRVLTVLFNSPDHQATYLELIRAAYPHLTEATKTNKALLYKILDGIKKKLAAPVIENVPRLGYRLVFKDKEPKGKQG